MGKKKYTFKVIIFALTANTVFQSQASYQTYISTGIQKYQIEDKNNAKQEPITKNELNTGIGFLSPSKKYDFHLYTADFYSNQNKKDYLIIQNKVILTANYYPISLKPKKLTWFLGLGLQYINFKTKQNDNQNTVSPVLNAGLSYYWDPMIINAQIAYTNINNKIQRPLKIDFDVINTQFLLNIKWLISTENDPINLNNKNLNYYINTALIQKITDRRTYLDLNLGFKKKLFNNNFQISALEAGYIFTPENIITATIKQSIFKKHNYTLYIYNNYKYEITKKQNTIALGSEFSIQIPKTSWEVYTRISYNNKKEIYLTSIGLNYTYL